MLAEPALAGGIRHLTDMLATLMRDQPKEAASSGHTPRASAAAPSSNGSAICCSAIIPSKAPSSSCVAKTYLPAAMFGPPCLQIGLLRHGAWLPATGLPELKA